MIWRWSCSLLVALVAWPVRAESARRVLSRAQQEVTAGGKLRVELEAAHGLTPPPGIQSDRALRGFAARLCAAEAHAACVPLSAVNVRPRDGLSLVYRAEFAVPQTIAAGRYDLDVRFPGGDDALPAGVVVRAGIAPAEPPPAAALVSHGCAVAREGDRGAPLGLLLLLISWKLAAARQARRSKPLE